MSKANPKQICGKRNKSQEAKKIRAEGEKGKGERETWPTSQSGSMEKMVQ